MERDKCMLFNFHLNAETRNLPALENFSQNNPIILMAFKNSFFHLN